MSTQTFVKSVLANHIWTSDEYKAELGLSWGGRQRLLFEKSAIVKGNIKNHCCLSKCGWIFSYKTILSLSVFKHIVTMRVCTSDERKAHVHVLQGRLLFRISCHSLLIARSGVVRGQVTQEYISRFNQHVDRMLREQIP